MVHRKFGYIRLILVISIYINEYILTGMRLSMVNIVASWTRWYCRRRDMGWSHRRREDLHEHCQF